MVFSNLRKTLLKTKNYFFGRIEKAKGLEEVEEILYTSDLGSKTALRFMNSLNDSYAKAVKEKDHADQKGLSFYREILRKEALNIFQSARKPSFPPSSLFIGEENKRGSKVLKNGVGALLEILSDTPQFWMFVGVNGVGKTTSIGKLAYHLGKVYKVLVVAGDTFRAAAKDQLKIWSERANVELFQSKVIRDPAALAFQACERAKSKKFDIILLDTAGRLHTKTHLMEELKKVKRVVKKLLPLAPHEIFAVLDAHSGQNVLNQAEFFHKNLGLSGLILNKLDGTAKGGVVLGLIHELKIPIYWIGVGEKKEDIRAFNSQEFVESLFF